jgi:hypothetical protein
MLRKISPEGGVERARARSHSMRENLAAGLESCAIDESSILDLRELEAPEPLERILAASSALPPGDDLLVRTPRFPRMLFPHLDARGLDWEAAECADQSALVWVRRPG